MTVNETAYEPLGRDPETILRPASSFIHSSHIKSLHLFILGFVLDRVLHDLDGLRLPWMWKPCDRMCHPMLILATCHLLLWLDIRQRTRPEGNSAAELQTEKLAANFLLITLQHLRSQLHQAFLLKNHCSALHSKLPDHTWVIQDHYLDYSKPYSQNLSNH